MCYNIQAFKTHGGIAQLARATGSYPVGHGFKSNSRYQIDKMRSYSAFCLRPVSQAVKTSPFHGEGMGSIPVRVTKIKLSRTSVRLVLFIQAAGLAWNQCACALHGIAEGVWHHAQACINFSCGLIPYRNKLRIPYAHYVSNSIHGFAVIWYEGER